MIPIFIVSFVIDKLIFIRIQARQGSGSLGIDVEAELRSVDLDQRGRASNLDSLAERTHRQGRVADRRVPCALRRQADEFVERRPTGIVIAIPLQQVRRRRGKRHAKKAIRRK